MAILRCTAFRELFVSLTDEEGGEVEIALAGFESDHMVPISTCEVAIQELRNAADWLESNKPQTFERKTDMTEISLRNIDHGFKPQLSDAALCIECDGGYDDPLHYARADYPLEYRPFVMSQPTLLYIDADGKRIELPLTNEQAEVAIDAVNLKLIDDSEVEKPCHQWKYPK